MTQALTVPRMRVLIVDDDLDTVESIASLLIAQGHVITALNGVEAIALANTFEPNLVLLDIGMPEVDGYAVARELRRTEGTRIEGTNQSVIVAVTGHVNAMDRFRCADAGFDLHLAKPLDPSMVEQLTWFVNEPYELHQELPEMSAVETVAFAKIVGLAIDMARALLDLAGAAPSAEARQQYLARTLRTHGSVLKLVQSRIPNRAELISALARLKQRCDAMTHT
jgi:CheY-like chemotaxis protein